jgi:Holliday junction resolvasome RuvABC endonuclease subunit
MLGGPVQRLLLLQSQLDQMAARGDVATVAYEEVRRHTGTQAAHVWGALEGVVQLAAARHGWRLLPVGVGTVKRRLTGSGAARKGSMVRAACTRWGLGECGEDEADALAVALAALDVMERTP